MIDAPPVVEIGWPSGRTLAPAEIVEMRASSLRRLSILLRLAEGTWALAVVESGDVQRLMVEELRQAITPLPFVEVSLLRRVPDPLAILRDLDHPHPAPVVSLHEIGQGVRDLCGYLDVQRDSLARHLHRLLLWVTPYERRLLVQHAPNFYSRLSGVFYFPGTPHVQAGDGIGAAAAVRAPGAEPAISPAHGDLRRRRPYLPVREERQREAQIRYLQERIQDLRGLSRPDMEAVGDAWYDLAGLYETDTPRRWPEAEAAYGEAARVYALGGLTLAEAEARYRAGDAAMRATRSGPPWSIWRPRCVSIACWPTHPTGPRTRWPARPTCSRPRGTCCTS